MTAFALSPPLARTSETTRARRRTGRRPGTRLPLYVGAALCWIGWLAALLIATGWGG